MLALPFFWGRFKNPGQIGKAAVSGRRACGVQAFREAMAGLLQSPAETALAG